MLMRRIKLDFLATILNEPTLAIQDKLNCIQFSAGNHGFLFCKKSLKIQFLILPLEEIVSSNDLDKKTLLKIWVKLNYLLQQGVFSNFILNASPMEELVEKLNWEKHKLFLTNLDQNETHLFQHVSLTLKEYGKNELFAFSQV